MPHEGEFASKASHSPIVRHPDVSEFLDGCAYLREPTAEVAAELAAQFVAAADAPADQLPPHVIAIDGSWLEGSVDPRLLPSTRVGYVQIGCVLIDVLQFQHLRAERGMVDPFAVARLEDANAPLVFPVPSSNVRWGGAPTVRAGFRAAIDRHFYGTATRFRPEDPETSLRTTLFALASAREGPLGTGDPTKLRLHACPNLGCAEREVEIRDVSDQQFCPACGGPVFPTDCLRIWENVEDYQPNLEALGRLAMTIEHLMPIHYIRWILKNSPTALSETGFFIDGALAVFGNAAWIHGPILRLLCETNDRLRQLGLPDMVVVAVQKSGLLVDYMSVSETHVPPGRLRLVDDQFRYGRIMGSSGRQQGRRFGAETYYGQDFLYKTPSGRSFVFSLPYPNPDKSSAAFSQMTDDLGAYSTLARALGLIRRFESDLYKNATIPAVLAHKYTAISLRPGGQVLDLLTRRALMPSSQ